LKRSLGASLGQRRAVITGQESGTMKAVVIGEPSGASMEAIMAVYPRHKVVVDKS